MCFFKRPNDYLQTANGEIKCWKLVYPIYKNRQDEHPIFYFSEFMGKKYHLGERNGEPAFTETIKDAEEGNPKSSRNLRFGFHSYTSIKKAQDAIMSGQVIVECAIPDGSRYYKSALFSEFLSEAIVIKKEVFCESIGNSD